MKTEITGNNETHGWVFYDGDCALCVKSAGRARRWLERHGFRLLPLQTPGTEDRLGVGMETLLRRMHLLAADGRIYSGADAFIEIARHVRWARWTTVVAKTPAVLGLLRRLYDWIANHRNCAAGRCAFRNGAGLIGWLPLLVVPLILVSLRTHLADWVFMWIMAMGLYAGCKWLTFHKATRSGCRFTTGLAIGYLLCWVGMDPTAFARRNSLVTRPRVSEWLAALLAMGIGAALIWKGVRHVCTWHEDSAGWVGMIGIVLLLHFGLFRCLALAWMQAGVAVAPLMRAPLLATSLGNFWGVRWNTGFHTLAHDLVFRPLRTVVGAASAAMAVFLVSGLIHELVITLPARGGYGLPTGYFLVQGFGLAFERSSFGKALGLARGMRGRVFALVVVVAPAYWLFPPVFVRNIIQPMLRAIGAT